MSDLKMNTLISIPSFEGSVFIDCIYPLLDGRFVITQYPYFEFWNPNSLEYKLKVYILLNVIYKNR